MLQVRPPAVAGAFYAGQPQRLSADVHALLEAAGAKGQVAASVPKAIIVPHAGYIYSGSTAALAYARLAAGRKTIRRVVLLGPVHRVAVRGLALPGAAVFATPLGELAIDQAAVALIAGLPQVVVSPAAHVQEHSLEVQLPFLQSVLDDFTLVPLAVGDATAAEVAQVLDVLWGGPETLLVISSDLSHFLPYGDAQRVDQESVQGILAMGGPLTHRQACGGTPINGLILAAQRHGLQAELLGLCNSGDTAGDKNRVVGYASFAFTPDSSEAAGRGKTMLAIARASIAQALGQGSEAAQEDASWLQEPGACFVTLMQHGRLRGCVGTLQANRSLLADLKANAQAAAFRDPRFAPLSAADFAGTDIEVSLLSPMQAMRFTSEADALAQLRPGVDGVLLAFGQHRATFLPQVWEQLPEASRFMAQLKQKAGLAADFWDPGVRLHRYTASKWKETELGGEG